MHTCVDEQGAVQPIHPALSQITPSQHVHTHHRATISPSHTPGSWSCRSPAPRPTPATTSAPCRCAVSPSATLCERPVACLRRRCRPPPAPTPVLHNCVVVNFINEALHEYSMQPLIRAWQFDSSALVEVCVLYPCPRPPSLGSPASLPTAPPQQPSLSNGGTLPCQ